MGIISTLTRRMRNNRVTRRLSTSSTKLEDEDSNDLIKTTWETASATRPSVESTSTMVHHTLQDPVLPSESPNRLRIKTDNVNMRTLFDQTPISPTDRAKEALSNNEYPIFKLDMCQSPFQAPKKLQDPLETKDWRGRSASIKNGAHKSAECSSSTSIEKHAVQKNNRRSMTALLKKHCGLNIPRSSLSIKRGNSPSPKWLDSADMKDEGELVDMKNEKLLEVHLQNGKRNSMWHVGFGRPW
ncbi:uncharacterized protein N7529_003147 [Penicillium soppii]|uniref:uncharacterized protein n=1 Tax=Penicillium soppii TaxID=69789 RepID=UPI00254751F7|nr:uncharacterized protein N7529_003147 [Penicillium soppii]KAJ5874717.1 hypothetical protein N7529_003147 [Penicillium soppii]